MAGPNSQNQYTPQAVALDGGLDLITPKVAVAGGTLSGCYNFERTDRMGYSRIYGYERFDGAAFPSLTYTNTVYLVHASDAFTIDARSAAFVEEETTPFGYVVEHGSTYTSISVTDFDSWRVILAAINAGNTIDITADGQTLTITDVQSFDEFQTAAGVVGAKELTLARNALYRAITNLVGYPGKADNPVIGLWGYKDQVYAVKDLQTAYFENGNTEVFPNAILRPNGGSSDDDLYITKVTVLSGAWGSSDAAGVLELIPKVGATISNTSYDLINEQDSAVITANVLDIAAAPGGVDMVATNANLWRSNNYLQAQALSVSEGWNPLRQGFLIEFEGGSQGPFVLYNRGVGGSVTTDVISTVSVAASGTTVASNPGGLYTFSTVGAGSIAAALNNDSLSSYEHTVISGSSLVTPGNIVLSNFTDIAGFSADPTIEVKGVELMVTGRFTFADSSPRTASIAVQPSSSGSLVVGSSPQTQLLPADASLPVQDLGQLTFGGPTSLFGLSAAQMKSNLDSNFGFFLQPFVSKVTTSYAGTIDIYYVQIKVYYTITITNYYFWNGVDDVTGKLTYQFLDPDTSWSESDASGIVQITDVIPVASGTRYYVSPGDEIRTQPGGAGVVVATVVATDQAFVYNGLAPLSELETAKSRYQFITANFTGNEDFEAFYGVSGPRRAFTYDGFYFNTIYTQIDSTKDKPRHVSDHQFHLVLGFASGSNQLSVIGEPTNFDGTAGAIEIDTGDPVVGYARMEGTTLGIFCKNSIHGLTGTSIDNFSLTVLNPYEGAIEYTVADVGRPIYCSNKGISIFDQTSAYGDFAKSRLSYIVSPWLLPRLQGVINPIGTVGAGSAPVVGIAYRSLNQYWLCMGDGYWLCMTLAQDQQPHFTIRAPAIYSDTPVEGLFKGFFVPRAEASWIDSTGAEHIHLGHYSKSATLSTYYVYEYGKSWTFDGKGIPCYIISNENFFGSPFNYDNARKCRLHGMSLGYAPIKMHVGKDYESNDDKTYSNQRVVVDASLPREVTAMVSDDFEPTTNMSALATRGRSFSMKFMSYNTITQPLTTKDPVNAEVCPPFVLQAMLVQHTENKGDV